MKRTTVLSIIVAASLIGSTTVSFADKLSDYQTKEKQLQQEETGKKSNISSLKGQESSIHNQVLSLQTEVNSLQKTITATEIDLQRRNLQITQLKGTIAQTQKQMNTQYAVLKNRIRLMYESGQTSYMDVLFSSSSFSDMLSRLQLLSIVADQDKKILGGIEANKQRLLKTNQQLTGAQTTEQSLYETLKKKEEQQAIEQENEQNLLTKVHDERVKEEIDLANENAAMANLKATISQLEASEGGGYTGPSDGWVWPVPSSHQISSGYGNRTWADGHVEFHNGVDIPAPVGTPIVAATGGKVLMAGPATGFGDWIVIQSSGGLLEIYGHMYSWEIRVSPGQVVSAGQQIAGVGSNGESTGPHLHFTIATGFDSSGYAVSVNPLNYIHP